MKLLPWLIVLALTACSSTSGLSIYSLSNEDIETLLNQNVSQLDKNMTVMMLPVAFEVTDLAVNIGPDNREVVALNVNSLAQINALAFSYPVRLQLQLEGSPYYDSAKKAIFLRDVSLLNSVIDAGGYRGNLNFLDKEVMKILNSFLAVNPVYSLDLQDPKMALLSKLPLDLQVVNGAIKLVPRI